MAVQGVAKPMETKRLHPLGAWPAPETRLEVREVYFVRGVTTGLIKIGVANNARRRIADLQLASPDRLELLATIQTDRVGSLEKELHLRFAALREHGEWFRPSPEIMQCIGNYILDGTGLTA